MDGSTSTYTMSFHLPDGSTIIEQVPETQWDARIEYWHAVAGSHGWGSEEHPDTLTADVRYYGSEAAQEDGFGSFLADFVGYVERRGRERSN